MPGHGVPAPPGLSAVPALLPALPQGTPGAPSGTLPANPAAALIAAAGDPGAACGADPSWVCEQVFDWTGSNRWAGFAEWFVAKPLAIVLIAIAAWIVSRLGRRFVKRSLERMVAADHQRARRLLRKATPNALLGLAEPNVRAEARAQALATVFRSLVSLVVWFAAIVWMLDVLQIDLAPLLASAGVVGVAVGFGAQNIVRDFLAGTFILLEDQFGVGDVIDLGEAKGTVEGITFRSTKVRDVNGVLWHVPNGQILRVANKSQQWSRAVLDIEVDHETDYDLAQRVMQETAEALVADPDWSGDVIGEPEVWGIESFTADGYTIRLVIKTQPASQFGVMRELRIRLKAAFDRAGIFFPGARPELWVHEDAPADPAAKGTASTSPVGADPPAARPPGDGPGGEGGAHPKRGDAAEG